MRDRDALRAEVPLQAVRRVVPEQARLAPAANPRRPPPSFPALRALVDLIVQGSDLAQGHHGLLHVHEDAAETADVLAYAEVDLAKGIVGTNLHGTDSKPRVLAQREEAEDQHEAICHPLDPVRDPRGVVHGVPRIPMSRNECVVLLQDTLLQCHFFLAAEAVELPPMRDDPSAGLEPCTLEVLPRDHGGPHQLSSEPHAEQTQRDDDDDTQNGRDGLPSPGRCYAGIRAAPVLRPGPERKADSQHEGQKERRDGLEELEDREVSLPGDDVRVIDQGIQPAGI
mmetsp:Transcript_67810/g.172115  ORF Transcript_67810/g.172115 Transcript_67810/m.172115 type:complete len:283 (+) Transcript_67810:915-1763(+)